jgi:hypothetical protein
MGAGIVYVIIGLVLISIAYEKLIIPVGNFIKDTKFEPKWLLERREQHELLINTVNGLHELEEQRKIDVQQSMKHDAVIRNDLAELKSMFIDREIDSMRWSILNFCTDISSGKKVKRESFDYILKTYDKYERILDENGMENGLVNESIKYIKEQYHEQLKNGF